MDITQFLPATVTVAIICVVIFAEIVKKLDKKDRLKGYRVWLPTFFSLGFAALLRLGSFIEAGQVWYYWAVIFAIATFSYEAILKTARKFFF